MQAAAVHHPRNDLAHVERPYGVGVTLLAAILTFGFALLGAHRATQATLNARMDRMDQANLC